MLLRLTVARSNTPEVPPGVSWEFAPPGFSIGRQQAECQLPDPEKRVSRHHADVLWQGEDVLLRDQSHNGTLINGVPVGQGNAVRLMDGDVLEIGPYLLAVSFASDIDIDLPGLDLPQFDRQPLGSFGAAAMPTPLPRPNPPNTDEVLDPLAALDGVSFPPGEEVHPFVPRPSVAPPISPLHAPVAAVRERLELPRQIPPSTPCPNAPAEPVSEEGPGPFFELTGFPSGRKQQNLPANPPQAPAVGQAGWAARTPDYPPVAAPALGRREVAASEAPPIEPPRSKPAPAADHVWEAFLEGLGVSPEHVAPADAEAFANIGRLLRAAVEGLMELLQARAKVKYGFAMAGTIGAAQGNNPLKLMTNLEHVLHYLLEPRPGFLHGDQAISEGLRDVRTHEAAMVAGMQAALRALVERFDPKGLEEQLPASGSSPLGSFNRAGRLWQAYVADYEKHVRHNFAELWGEAFNDEYERVVDAARYGRDVTPPMPPPRGRRR